MAWMKQALALICILLLSACATVPPVTSSANMCRFRMWRAEVVQPPITPTDRTLLLSEPDNVQLLMSGGGQHGAFGAGLLQQWQTINGGHLPRFSLVTGISTGAMLSTFAFLDDPKTAVEAYSIKSESDLLKAYAKRTSSGFTTGSYISIAKHSALGDLSPLRAVLHKAITLDTLAQISARSYHRQLLVGAVDVDSGDAVVFDLTEMAQRATKEQDTALKEHFRDCYIEAIMASGSVPLAAPPIFIDNREYIDGGARFGVFSDSFGQSAGLASTDRSRPAAPLAGKAPILFVLVNGTQEVDPHCGKSETGGGTCKDGVDAFDNLDGGHESWALLALAKRSSDVLINQVYRFSVSDIVQRYDEAYQHQSTANVHYMPIIESEAEAFQDPDLNQSCVKLQQQDDEKLKPLEFYPHYMRCLIAYGRSFAQARSQILHVGGTPAPTAVSAAQQQ